MELLNGTPFAVAWLAGRLRYPAHSLTVIVKATFDLIPGERARVSAEQVGIGGDQPYPGEKGGSLYYESDLAYRKPQADRLLVGRCHALNGAPTVACQVRFTIGSWSRALHVIGDRVWKKQLLGTSPTSPEKFTVMDLRYENAFGGPDYAPNPLGKGFQRAGSDADNRVHNIEDPGQPVKAQNERPVPAGFGPISRTWWPRKQLIGSYGKEWFRTRCPWFPADMDWKVCNAAPIPSLVNDYLHGDEPIMLLNLHPIIPRLEARLPGLRVRSFVRRVSAPGTPPRSDEVGMKLDTLWIDAERAKMVLVWRGDCDVSSDEFEDVRRLHVLSEPTSENPRKADEVVALFADPAPRTSGRRSDDVSGGSLVAGAAEADAPSHPAGTGSAGTTSGSGGAEPGIAGGESERSPDLDAEHVDPAASMDDDDEDPPEDLPPPTTLVEDLKATLAILPTGPAATPEMEEARQEILALIAELSRPEPAEPPRPVEAERPPWTRERVCEELAGAGALAGEDLSGLDLSGVDFRGVSLRRTSLRNANLRAAILVACELVEADLENVVGDGIDLSGSDLGGSILRKGQLRNAKLNGAQAIGAIFAEADLSGAELNEADLSRADLRGAVLEDVSARKAALHGACLERVRADRSDWGGAILDEALLADASFATADLTGASLYKVRAPRIDLTGADLAGAVILESDLSGAQCRWIRGEDSQWIGTALDKSDFFEADLDRANFSKSSLTVANLNAAGLRQGILMKTNLEGATVLRADLFQAVLTAARLTRTDLRGSNLFGADLGDAEMTGANLQTANLKRTRLDEA